MTDNKSDLQVLSPSDGKKPRGTEEEEDEHAVQIVEEEDEGDDGEDTDDEDEVDDGPEVRLGFVEEPEEADLLNLNEAFPNKVGGKPVCIYCCSFFL